MWVKVNEITIFYDAVESIRFDPSTRDVVVRTVSGAEHRQHCGSASVGDTCTRELRERVAMYRLRFRTGRDRAAARSLATEVLAQPLLRFR